MTFLFFETGQPVPGERTRRSLFLLKGKEALLVEEEFWGEMATGGISMELSCGGGCCHCGSGPAKRRV